MNVANAVRPFVAPNERVIGVSSEGVEKVEILRIQISKHSVYRRNERRMLHDVALISCLLVVVVRGGHEAVSPAINDQVEQLAINRLAIPQDAVASLLQRLARPSCTEGDR